MAALHWHKWEKDGWSENDEKDNAGRKKGLAEISRDCFDEWGEIGYRQLLLAVFLFCCNASANCVQMKELMKELIVQKGKM